MTDALSLIRQRLTANWTTTPIAWTNVHFDPQNPGGAFPAGGAFIYLDEDLPNDTFQATIGNTQNSEREIGAVMIHIFTPVESGAGQAQEYAASLASLFRWWQSGHLFVRSPRRASSEVDGDWYRYSLYIPYQVDNMYNHQ